MPLIALLRNKWLSPLLVAMLIAVTFLCLLIPSVSAEATETEFIPVSVYVVCLDDVSVSWIGNVSRVVEGVMGASRHACKIHYRTGEYRWKGAYLEPIFGEINVNVTVIEVTDWDTYKNVVESSSGTIIVNAHGEVLPIPNGYTREGWADQIAQAMLYRNVTWAHMAGYPFYKYFHQESGEGTWGEAGFQRLMSFIGKGNVTCWPPEEENEQATMNGAAIDNSMRDFYRSPFDRVDLGRPLNGSDFQDYIAMPIFTRTPYYITYYTGAVVAFKDLGERCSFGFYVHVGTRRTYDMDGKPTDEDYWRGYCVTASAIWENAVELTALAAISDAQKAILTAQAEERVDGLGEAQKILQEAENAHFYHQNYVGKFYGAIWLAKKAKEAADQATKPSSLEVYIVPITVTVSSILGIIATWSFIIKRRNNRRKNFERAEDE